jgi:hypothetical protein
MAINILGGPPEPKILGVDVLSEPGGWVRHSVRTVAGIGTSFL